MSKLEDIAMRESPLLTRLRREPPETVAAAPVSFADKFLARYYRTIPAEPEDKLHVPPPLSDSDQLWLADVAREMDRQLAAYGAAVNQRLLCRPAAWEVAMAEAMAAPTCECGSGSNEPSGAHSHWCRLWTAP